MASKKVKLYSDNNESAETTLSFEHAEKLLTLQVKMDREDWKLSEGQKLTFKDGKLINTPSSKGED